MSKFSYIAKDKTGKTYKNVVNAESRDELISKLQKQNLFIVSVAKIAYKTPKSGKDPRKKRRQFRYKKIKLQDLLTFSRQLATMLEAGVPLIRSISVIQSQIQSKKFLAVIDIHFF